MTVQSVVHATFSLDRRLDASVDQAFEAWSVPAAKRRWFAPGPGSDHELDFRVGGREVTRGTHDGKVMTFESRYQDIVPGLRIVYTSTLSSDQTLATVSMTTVEFAQLEGGTQLVLTEHGAFLDGHEEPAWRQRGTGDWLDAFVADVRGQLND